MMNYAEDRVQQSIVQWLRLKGYLVTFTGGGTIKSAATQRMANRLGYLTGISDLIVFIPGGTVCIECKRPAGYKWSKKLNKLVYDSQSGKQSEAQKDFEKKIVEIPGHYYLVATCINDVTEFFKQFEN